MATQTYTSAGGNQLTAENAEYYQRAMLDRLQDSVVFMNYGNKAKIPKHAGATTSWRRLEMPATLATTAITEGVTPASIDLTINKVQATVQQFGAWTKITDFVDLVGLDPILTETSQLMGDYAGLSMDAVVRDIVVAGTSVLYANNRISRVTVAAGDKITAADIMKMRETMVKNFVKPVKLPNGGSGYLAFTHPSVVTNIMSLQEWKDQNTYVDVKNREKGIAGQMYGIYFMEAPSARVFAGEGASGIDVYSTLIIGQGAYGIPDIAGSSKPEILVFSSGNTENPLELYKTCGWKSCFTAARLNEKCILRYESSIT
ncbi:MAG: N4-gp56 family major capsid protein [Firmicutes bacterium]|nr:N4-gp56 family major capsid protein [Bacillota bacterium]